LEIDNYYFFRRDRISDTKTKGGGILIYIRNEFKAINVSDTYDPNIDYMWVKLISVSSNITYAGFFYRPPDASEEQLKFLIEKMCKFKTVNTIIIGDFNFGDINWKNSTSGTPGKIFLNTIIDQSLTQCVKSKTREKNTLDLVFVYDKKLISKLSTATSLGKSDHSIIQVQLNRTVSLPQKRIKCYNYKMGKYKILKNEFENINWIDEIENKTVNEVWEYIVELLNTFKEKHIPWFIRDVNKDVPWINIKIKKLIRKRNNLFKRYKKKNQSYIKAKYVCARNLVTIL